MKTLSLITQLELHAECQLGMKVSRICMPTRIWFQFRKEIQDLIPGEDVGGIPCKFRGIDIVPWAVDRLEIQYDER